MQKLKFKFIFLLSALCFLLSVAPALAQSLILKSAKSSYNVGDSFSVSLSINTDGQAINTISGTISVPTDKFQIVDVRYGSSIVSLWVDKPKIDYNNGTIIFTGGIPGGYNGSNGPILSFGLKAKKVGSAVVGLQDIKVLLNDGIGTELKNISLNTLSLNISEAPAKPVQETPAEPEKNPPAGGEEIYAPTPDITPPENFIPVISRHPSIENNKFFASFFAVDKDTGISYYEVEEKPFLLSLVTDKFNKPFIKADSPNILRGQYWSYRVIVRAYDQAGNYTTGFADKPFSPIILLIFVLILIAISIIVTRFVSHPQRRKKMV
ncbi:MAG: cohesin domain-containing protein [Candidatus Paceibacterota bacterium]